MKYYIDIKIISDDEINLGFLWKKVYQQIHLALVEAKNEKIALSFPNYGSKIFPMGNILRIFAQTQEEIEALSLKKWLDKLKDYTVIGNISMTSTVHKYVQFRRQQFKFHKDIIRRAEHQAKRRNISLEEALKHFEGYKEKENKLPYLMYKSLSSNQEIRLFIEKKEFNSKQDGDFNTFGLSKTATVPWF
jgi:CRISPR-associated endonuclease Csy4